MKSLSSYIPFAPIPATQERPNLSPLLRQWIFGFYDPLQSDSILFLRLHVLNLVFNIAICAAFTMAMLAPFSRPDETEAAQIAASFLWLYPRRLVPWLLLVNCCLALLFFFLQSPSFTVQRRHEEKDRADPDEGIYAKGNTGQYIGAIIFSAVMLCRLDAIPHYFMRHKIYASMVDVAGDPLETIIGFALVYVFLFQLFIVNSFAFCVVALARKALLKFASHQ